jgi:prepilin-type N-terminal cleavage/methylation domain-containing protein
MNRRRPATSDDAGFTLIELLVAIVVMGVIFVPLGNFLLAYLDNYSNTSQRLSDSHDIQMATAYFSQDVANVGMHATTSPYDFVQSTWTTGYPASYCGQGAGTTKLLMKSDSWSVTSSGGKYTGTSTGPMSVAYVVEGSTLHRLYCATGTTVSSDVSVVDNLTGASVACTAASGSSTSCESSAPPPAKITLSLTISGGSTDSVAPEHAVTLDGERRQS